MTTHMFEIVLILPLLYGFFLPSAALIITQQPDLQPEPSAPRNSSCVNLLDAICIQQKRQAFVLGSMGQILLLCLSKDKGELRVSMAYFLQRRQQYVSP